MFVEGSEGLAARRGPLLQAMWDRLAKGLGIHGFSTIVPISKKHLVAMDPAKPRMSGAGGLDQLMARCAAAKRRYDELASHSSPSRRPGPHRAALHEVVAVCMDPMFESLLLQREQDVVAALEVESRPPGWPRRGWGPTTRRPDHDVLVPMIDALRTGPRKQWPRVVKAIGTDARNKDPWLEYLLRRLLDDPEARALVLAHPICRRLAECLTLP